MAVLVAPLVFRAPEGPAAREARRPHFVRRRASKPARALRSLRRPPHQWGRVAGVWFGASSRNPARPRRRPPVPRPGPVDQAVRFLETPVAFARSCLCGVETAITFAGENRAVLMRLLVAVVTVVSTVAVQGRAVVLLVSISPRRRVLRAKEFTLLGLMVDASAKKFAQRTTNAPKMAFYGVPGELCRGEVVAGRCRARFVEWQSLLVCSAWEVLPRYREYPGPGCRSSVSPLV